MTRVQTFWPPNMLIVLLVLTVLSLSLSLSTKVNAPLLVNTVTGPSLIDPTCVRTCKPTQR